MTEPYRDTGPRHRRRRAGRGKLDVLHGARRVIALRGADATRFRDVADETGSAVSTLQYSFGSREDLIIAALEDAAEADLERARRAAAAASGAVAQLRALVCESVIADSDETTRDQWLVWVEYWRAAARDSELRAGSAASTRGGGRWSAGSWPTAARPETSAAISIRIRLRSRCSPCWTASAYRSCSSIPA